MAVEVKKKKVYKDIVPVPYDPENSNLTREQFIAKRAKAKAMEEKMAAYKAQLEAEDGIARPAEQFNLPEAPKRQGRPKKI